MGEVYLARDPNLHRDVAIKTIRPDMASLDLDGEATARFEREARSAAQLHHPNVVAIHEFGREGDLLYLVLERVEGETLSTLLAAKALSRPEILDLIAQVCEGLHHAHSKGIIHRDIKPANIMVTREGGRPVAKILDFGVAKMSGPDMTSTGQVVGTLGYMAPEYLKEGQASSASDQFSVGVLLFEALSGEKPFRGATTGGVVYGILHDAPKPLDLSHLDGLSPAIQGVVARTLDKEPSHRFATLLDLASALRAAKDPNWNPGDEPTTALRRPAEGTTRGHAIQEELLPEHRPAPAKRWPWIALGAGIALSLGAYLNMRTRPIAQPQTPLANVHINDAVLDEAEVLIASKPKDALKLVRAVIENTPKEGPVDPDAFALLMVCHYREGDFIRFGEALNESRDRGLHAKDLLTNKAYKAMLEADQRAKKIPAELRTRLLAGQDAE